MNRPFEIKLRIIDPQMGFLYIYIFKQSILKRNLKYIKINFKFIQIFKNKFNDTVLTGKTFKVSHLLFYMYRIVIYEVTVIYI